MREYYALPVVCKHCGYPFGYTQRVGPHVGIYCAKCFKWQRWLSKFDTLSIVDSNKETPQFIVINKDDELQLKTNSEYAGEIND